MQRRAFVQLVGGGVVLGAGLAGCGTGMPPAAISAWAEAGRDADPRRWILGHAILAPHSHNLQSWLVNLSRPGEIELRCDLTRLLPETDPLSRQTFIELLDIAARERGYRAELELFPEGAPGAQKLDTRPVARIRLAPDAGVAKDPLFAQIMRRHTNRSGYDPARAVPAGAWQAMAAATRPHPLHLGFVGVNEAALIRQHRAIANEAWRIELQTPNTFMESQRLLRIGAAEVAEHRDGISLLDTMPIALSRLGLFDRSKYPGADSFVIGGQIKSFAQNIETTPDFVWIKSEGNQRATQLNAGRAYARVQLAATAAGLAMQPLSQALQEYPAMAGPYAQIHRLLGANPAQQTVQMWARVGYAPDVGPAPRRGLEAHLRRA